MGRLVFILVLLLAGPAGAQWKESFDDGEWAHNPAWAGTPAKWLIVAKSDAGAGAVSNTLRLNAPAGVGAAWLSTQVNGGWGREQSWSFWLGRRGQPAGAWNVGFVWLYASEATVASGTVDGYRVRYGDDLPSGDHVVLECVHDGSASPIINSPGRVPEGLTDYGIQVRVTRSAEGRWNLYTSVLPQFPGEGAVATSGPEEATVFQGTIVDTTYSQFYDGYLSVSAIYTNSLAARAGIEFDQLQFSGGGFMNRVIEPMVDKEERFAGMDHRESNSLTVYPNPVHDQPLHVEVKDCPAGELKIQVWSVAGVLIKEVSLDHPCGALRTQVELPTLRKSVYWIVVSSTSVTGNACSGVWVRKSFVVQ